MFYSNISSLSAQFIEEKKDLKSYNGYFNFHYSPTEGKIYLEVDQLNKEFLYTHFLASGIGSNDIGLDRGQIGDGVVVKFIKSGNNDIVATNPIKNLEQFPIMNLKKNRLKKRLQRQSFLAFRLKRPKMKNTSST